jgi:hypothetical protein
MLVSINTNSKAASSNPDFIPNKRSALNTNTLASVYYLSGLLCNVGLGCCEGAGEKTLAMCYIAP